MYSKKFLFLFWSIPLKKPKKNGQLRYGWRSNLPPCYSHNLAAHGNSKYSFVNTKSLSIGVSSFAPQTPPPPPPRRGFLNECMSAPVGREYKRVDDVSSSECVEMFGLVQVPQHGITVLGENIPNISALNKPLYHMHSVPTITHGSALHSLYM